MWPNKAPPEENCVIGFLRTGTTSTLLGLALVVLRELPEGSDLVSGFSTSQMVTSKRKRYRKTTAKLLLLPRKRCGLTEETRWFYLGKLGGFEVLPRQNRWV